MSAVYDNDVDNDDGYGYAGHEVDDDVVVGTFHHTYCL